MVEEDKPGLELAPGVLEAEITCFPLHHPSEV